ncbi:MAG: hypothetical protein HY237_07135 [Acidobacteria bacterium]|nr:hypothetical protein [Acidobacteriota bacterium]
MQHPEGEPRHYKAGFYLCPVTMKEVLLEADVPRPWIHWPMRVACKACGSEHVLGYEQVRQEEPVFGHE